MGSKLVQINTVCNTGTVQIMHEYRKAIEKIEADRPDRQKIAEHGSRYKRQSMTDKILKLYEGLQ